MGAIAQGVGGLSRALVMGSHYVPNSALIRRARRETECGGIGGSSSIGGSVAAPPCWWGVARRRNCVGESFVAVDWVAVRLVEDMVALHTRTLFGVGLVIFRGLDFNAVRPYRVRAEHACPWQQRDRCRPCRAFRDLRLGL